MTANNENIADFALQTIGKYPDDNSVKLHEAEQENFQINFKKIYPHNIFVIRVNMLYIRL